MHEKKGFIRKANAALLRGAGAECGLKQVFFPNRCPVKRSECVSPPAEMPILEFKRGAISWMQNKRFVDLFFTILYGD